MAKYGSQAEQRFLFNHVFFPMKLPCADDFSANNELCLFNSFTAALESFPDVANELPHQAVLLKMLKHHVAAWDANHNLDAQAFAEQLSVIESGEFLFVHVKAQNAGVIVQGRQDDLVFRLFGLSASSNAVTSAKGRLSIQYPDEAYAVPRARMRRTNTCHQLAALLAQLDTVEHDDVRPKSRKGGQQHNESRDIADPRLITEMLAQMLHGLGSMMPLHSFKKNIRDEISYQGTAVPWRRSASWVLLRVACRMCLQELTSPEEGLNLSKKLSIFCLARFAKQLAPGLPSADDRLIMLMKVRRRIVKLGLDSIPDWLIQVNTTLRGIENQLEKQWHDMQNPKTFPPKALNPLTSLEWKRDTLLTLDNLKSYLAEDKNGKRTVRGPDTADATTVSRLTVPTGSLPEVQSLSSVSSRDQRKILLFDFEVWVRGCLSEWSSNQNSPDQQDRLERCIYKYAEHAQKEYQGNPESLSIMILTIVELWIAFDKVTLHGFPLLRQYGPELEAGMFDSLLLKTFGEMQRLAVVEDYIKSRQDEAHYPRLSVLRSFAEEDSIARKLYSESPAVQRLHTEIQNDTEAKISQLRQELRENTSKHEGLQREIRGMSCDQEPYQDEDGDWCETHRWDCRKCNKTREAASIKMNRFERPLPQKIEHVQAVLAELMAPRLFTKWRDMTFFVLADIRSAHKTGRASETHPLSDHAALRGYLTIGRRVGLASATKSLASSHYCRTAEHVTRLNPQSIVVGNAMQWQLYDSDQGQFMDQAFGVPKLQDLCALRFPKGDMQDMQYAIKGTYHTSNEVIAWQHKCPISLSRLEYYSIGTLRAGHRLQWRNLLRELCNGNIDFGRVESNLLVSQAIWEAGPRLVLGSADRKAHIDATELHFSRRLLDILKERTPRLSINWSNSACLLTLIIIACRQLSLTWDQNISKECLDVLNSARTIVRRWMIDFQSKILGNNEGSGAEDIFRGLHECSLIVHSTYEIGLSQLDILMQDDENLSCFLQSLISIYDYKGGSSSPWMQHLQDRSERLVCELEPIMRSAFLERPYVLDSLVKAYWPGYEGPGLWTAGMGSRSHYLSTRTNNAFNSSNVQVDILTGRLLVNGCRVSRLPSSFEQHETYRQLFGHDVVRVVPPSAEGMDFESVAPKHGYNIRFRMTAKNELIVTAVKNAQSFAYIPRKALRSEQMPSSFACEYHHWRDLQTKDVQLRPLHDPWNPENCRWKLIWSKNENISLQDGTSVLVANTSETFYRVTSSIKAIEVTDKTCVTISRAAKTICVSLPRLGLDFELQEDNPQLLQSRQLPGSSVDADQSIGCLTGLCNKLVLRGRNGLRTLLIPYGDVSFHKAGIAGPVYVKVAAGTSESRTYFSYEMDPFLQRLIDGEQVESKLFCAYLHALTSHCMPDQFTGLTGTEAALRIVSGPAVLSFPSLSGRALHILSLIERISPRREFYPAHKQEMQTTHWDPDLPIIAQHPDFALHAKSIIDNCRMLCRFSTDQTRLPDLMRLEPRLLHERARIRDAQFRTAYAGADSFSVTEDITFERPPRDEADQACDKVFHISRMIDRWSSQPTVSSRVLEYLKQCNQPIRCSIEAVKSLSASDPSWRDFDQSKLCHYWSSLIDQMARADPEVDNAKLIVMFTQMAYSKHVDKALFEMLNTLIAIATVPDLKNDALCAVKDMHLSRGCDIDESQFRSILSSGTAYSQPKRTTPAWDLSKGSTETHQKFNARRNQKHDREWESARSTYISSAIADLRASRPISTCAVPRVSSYIKVRETASAFSERNADWNRNRAFEIAVTHAQGILDSARGEQSVRLMRGEEPPFQPLPPKLRYLSWPEIMSGNAPTLIPASRNVDSLRSLTLPGAQPMYSRVPALLSKLLNDASNIYEKGYVKELQDGLDSFQKIEKAPATILEEYEVLQTVRVSKETFENARKLITQALQMPQLPAGMTQCATTFVRPTSANLLRLIASTSNHKISQSWRSTLICYAEMTADYQFSRRLADSFHNKQELDRQRLGCPHADLDPSRNTDWFLFEIENNVQIRKIQVDLANQMVSPPTNVNTVTQLNMGEGKSSVIVPIAAAKLADGKKLARIIVLKPLSKQMLSLLIKTLSGILGRRVFHLPVSRSVRLSVADVDMIRQICEDCIRGQGVMLIQPEHILSMHLMGIEQSLSPQNLVGDKIYATNQWLKSVSANLLDESDEILNVRCELIYAIGDQQQPHLDSDRWKIAQNLMLMVKNAVRDLASDHSDDFEYTVDQDGGFPRIRFLTDAAAEYCLPTVAKGIVMNGFPGISSWALKEGDQTAMVDFLTKRNLSKDQWANIRQRFPVRMVWHQVLLLRGHLAGGVLKFALQKKRWRVNYGVDPSRTTLAVPYRAKDLPSPRSEFSHPDIAIVLTMLSYYNEGLNKKEFGLALERLRLLDDDQTEFSAWTKDMPNLSPALQTLDGVNEKDESAMKELFSGVRKSKSAIDFYLGNVAFPADMKEFPKKLSSSGWDLAITKDLPTTGFSGTNDSKPLLPSSIIQYDRPELQSTNVAMLGRLIDAHNIFTSLPDGTSGSIIDDLIAAVVSAEPPIRTVLDVGAQVLDLDNSQFAKKWLGKLPEETTEAAIFFSTSNDLCVVDRKGDEVIFATSPFAKRVDKCLVFLDESHTRGVDSKLPADYRAAVTLGPRLAKDKLAQACMRMRKLGQGQTVAFMSPPEITRKIAAACDIADTDRIGVHDVVHWAVKETWAETMNCVPLWVTQRDRFERQQGVLKSATGEILGAHIASKLLEDEALTIEKRYGLTKIDIAKSTDPVIIRKLKNHGLTSLQDATMEEQQERELAPEREQEREVDRPPPRTPHTHNSSHQVRDLVVKGRPTSGQMPSDIFQAFQIFRKTSATVQAEYPPELDKTPIFATKDFKATIKTGNGQSDHYLRPAHWILRLASGKDRKSTQDDDLVLISPFEAMDILSLIRQHQKSDIALFNAQITRNSTPLEDMDFCNVLDASPLPISPRSASFLTLFSGQIFFSSFAKYICFCRCMGLWHPTLPDNVQGIRKDGFLSREMRLSADETWTECPFAESPVEFLRAVINIRRQGLDWKKSHLGRILEGTALDRNEFE